MTSASSAAISAVEEILKKALWEANAAAGAHEHDAGVFDPRNAYENGRRNMVEDISRKVLAVIRPPAEEKDDETTS